MKATGRLRSIAAATVLTTTLLVLCGPAAASVGGPRPLARSGRWITDSHGRVVIMHGVDIVKKLSPYYPSNFTAADAKFLADEGFTAARIGFIWAGDEPATGVYDDATIEHILNLNALLAKYGIRTLIDVHQDLWGGNETLVGDGAPAWASLGLEFEQNFQDFWNNDIGPGGVGIQTRFVDLWSHLAAMIKSSAAAGNLLGIDPLNEPQAGSGYGGCHVFGYCPQFETTQLYGFYEKVIAAVRASGYRGLIFPEGVPASGPQPPSLPAFSDRQVAFNFHYYCTASQFLPDPSGLISVPYCKSPDATAFSSVDAYSSKVNVPYIVSEFGGNDADAEYSHEVDLMGSRFLTWMYWMYYNYPTDPANFPTQGLLLNDDEPGSTSNVSSAKLSALVVPYAQAIAGTPKMYAFDRTSNVMTLSYTTRAVPGARLARGAETQIFVPQLDYPTGYRVTVTGARVTSSATSPWVELAATRGARSVSVMIAPRSGGSTELPSQLGFTPPTSSTPNRNKKARRHRKPRRKPPAHRHHRR